MSDLSTMSDAQLTALYQGMVANTAINKNESNGAPDSATGIVNPASGARGNMQVEPATAGQPGFGVRPSNGTPEDDARMARDYRAALEQHYGDPETAAIAYNMGPGKTDDWIANGRNLAKLPNETLKYLYKYKQTVASMPQVQSPGQTGTQAFGTATTPPQAAAAPAPQPTMTDQFLRQLGLTARAAGHGVGDAAGALTQGFTRLMGVPDVRDVINNAVDQYTPAPQGALEQGVQGVASQIANPINYALPAGGLARGAVGGALGAAMQPSAPGQTTVDALKAAAVGGATGGVMGGLGHALTGMRVSPAAQSLIDQDVTLTPGQAVGGVINKMEQKLTNTVPIVGEKIGEARNAALTQANEAFGNRVLAPINDTVDAGAANNVRTLAANVHAKISEQYDQILPQVTFRVDPQLAQDMAPVMMRVRGLPPDAQNAFMNNWQRNFGSQMTQRGTMTGQQFKDADSAFGAEARRFQQSTDAYQQNLGMIMGDTQTALRNSLQRTNPNVPSLGPINAAWRNYNVLRNAAARVNNPELPMMAGQMQAAVKQAAGNGPAGKAAFGEGRANMQDMTDNMMSVLGTTVPDSGTAGRSALLHAPATLAGLGSLAMAGHPIPAAAAAAGLGLGTAAYGTEAGRQAMLAALVRRPGPVRALGGIAGLLSPVAGAAAGNALNALQNRAQDQQ